MNNKASWVLSAAMAFTAVVGVLLVIVAMPWFSIRLNRLAHDTKHQLS